MPWSTESETSWGPLVVSKHFTFGNIRKGHEMLQIYQYDIHNVLVIWNAQMCCWWSASVWVWFGCSRHCDQSRVLFPSCEFVTEYCLDFFYSQVTGFPCTHWISVFKLPIWLSLLVGVERQVENHARLAWIMLWPIVYQIYVTTFTKCWQSSLHILDADLFAN